MQNLDKPVLDKPVSSDGQQILGPCKTTTLVALKVPPAGQLQPSDRICGNWPVLAISPCLLLPVCWVTHGCRNWSRSCEKLRIKEIFNFYRRQYSWIFHFLSSTIAIANIPYNITGEILKSYWTLPEPITSLRIVLVQKKSAIASLPVGHKVESLRESSCWLSVYWASLTAFWSTAAKS
jgi:hypothetical protein